GGGQDLVQGADARADLARQLDDVGARQRVAMADRDRRAEGDDGARSIADGVAHHLGELARERTLALLHALARQDVILQYEVVRDRRGNDDEIRTVGAQRRADETRFR